MDYNNDRLRQLSGQAARKRKIAVMLDSLDAQRRELETHAAELERQSQVEQSDVDRLERVTLTALFYRMTGKLEEQMDKERREACAARLKHQSALRELEDVRYQIAALEEEQRGLYGCEQALARALEEKREWLRQSRSDLGAQLLEQEAAIAALDSQEREIQEAQTAGNRALSVTDGILSDLSDAEGWGTWDLVGGGMLSAMAKHDALDKAQGQVEELQMALRRFQTELADVQVEADLQLQMDGFLRFADYFFDGLLADWAALDHINSCQKQVRDIRNQIHSVLDHLNWSLEQVQERRESLRQELERWVTDA
ncbi:MAG: hypothetical protein ACI3VN_09915 [Candidatus Onthomonas sp.]